MSAPSTSFPPYLSIALKDYFNYDVGSGHLFFTSKPQDQYIPSGLQEIVPVLNNGSRIVNFVFNTLRKLLPKKKPVNISHIEPELNQVSDQIETHFRKDLKMQYRHREQK